MKSQIGAFRGSIERNLKLEGSLRVKLKNFITKDQSANGAWVHELKLIKQGVNLKEIESLMVDSGQII